MHVEYVRVFFWEGLLGVTRHHLAAASIHLLHSCIDLLAENLHLRSVRRRHRKSSWKIRALKFASRCSGSCFTCCYTLVVSDCGRLSATVLLTGCFSFHGCSVDDLSHRLNRKKVGSNAKQLFLTGVAVLCPIARKNLVVVEGGNSP